MSVEIKLGITVVLDQVLVFVEQDGGPPHVVTSASCAWMFGNKAKRDERKATLEAFARTILDEIATDQGNKLDGWAPIHCDGTVGGNA
jgi:hypothetical protein